MLAISKVLYEISEHFGPENDVGDSNRLYFFLNLLLGSIKKFNSFL